MQVISTDLKTDTVCAPGTSLQKAIQCMRCIASKSYAGFDKLFCRQIFLWSKRMPIDLEADCASIYELFCYEIYDLFITVYKQDRNLNHEYS